MALPLNRYITFFSIAVGGCALDLVTKYLVFQNYFDVTNLSKKTWWVDGVLGIQTSFNNGALFGMMQGYQWLFVSLSVGAFIGIVYWLFFRRGGTDLLMLITMAMVSAGIFGNLYDRVGWGYQEIYGAENEFAVRDWIHFRWEGVSFLDPWPNFNLADSFLVCGAILLFVSALFGSPNQSSSTDQSTEDPQSESNE